MVVEGYRYTFTDATGQRHGGFVPEPDRGVALARVLELHPEVAAADVALETVLDETSWAAQGINGVGGCLAIGVGLALSLVATAADSLPTPVLVLGGIVLVGLLAAEGFAFVKARRSRRR